MEQEAEQHSAEREQRGPWLLRPTKPVLDLGASVVVARHGDIDVLRKASARGAAAVKCFVENLDGGGGGGTGPAGCEIVGGGGGGGAAVACEAIPFLNGRRILRIHSKSCTTAVCQTKMLKKGVCLLQWKEEA